MKLYPSTRFGPPHMDMLRRAIGTTDIDGRGTNHGVERQCDPFVFLDEGFLPPGVKPPFGRHPHTGLVANTIPLNASSGGMLWDNINGEYGPLWGGGVFQINAGRGVLHDEGREIEDEASIEERFGDCEREAEHQHVLQLWFNPGIGAPFHNEERPAEKKVVPPEDVPEVTLDGGLRVRVLLGEFGGKRAPCATWGADLLFLDCAFADASSDGGGARASARIELPQSFTTAFAYCAKHDDDAARIEVTDCSDGSSAECGPREIVVRESDGIRGTNALEISAAASKTRPRFFVGAGKPFNSPWVKLLGHDGAFLGPDEEFVRRKIAEYEDKGEEFGK